VDLESLMVSITEERRRLADVGFVWDDRRDQWGATGAYTDPRAVVTPALGFVQHIAVVTDSSDLLGTERQVMRTIEKIGWARFPNTGYSYNAAAFNSGRMMEGQPFGRRGAHTYNDENLSTCTTSGCPSRGQPLKFDGAGSDRRNLNYTHRAVVFPQQTSDPVTDAQVHGSARWAAAHILSGLAVTGARWHGHRCVSAKSCPGDRAWARMDDIADLTATYVRNGLPGDDMTPEESAQLAAIANAIVRLEGDGPGSFEAAVWNQGRGPEVRGQINTIETGVKTLVDRGGVDVDALAAAIVAKLPPGTPTDLATVKQGVREVLLEGVAPPPS
jgi:hypothetical protein